MKVLCIHGNVPGWTMEKILLYMGADVVTGKITKCWTGIIEHHISVDISYAVSNIIW